MVSRTPPALELSLLIQRVADGQASESDLERLAEAVDRQPGLAQQLEEMQQLSAQLRTELMAQARDVDFRAMQARVFQGVAANRLPATFGEKLKVWWQETLEHQRAIWVPGMGLAMAAGIAFLVPKLSDVPPSGAPALQASAQTDILSLDTEDTTAVVFQTGASNVTVIWLAGHEPEVDDEDEETPEPLENPSEVESEVGSGIETAVP